MLGLALHLREEVEGLVRFAGGAGVGLREREGRLCVRGAHHGGRTFLRRLVDAERHPLGSLDVGFAQRDAVEAGKVFNV